MLKPRRALPRNAVHGRVLFFQSHSPFSFLFTYAQGLEPQQTSGAREHFVFQPATSQRSVSY